MKTRKRQVILLVLLLAALLCACGQEPPGAPETPPQETHAATVTVIEDFLAPDFELTESLAMANYLCGNRALLSGETLYTLDFDVQLRPVLASWRYAEGTLSDYAVLAENCAAAYLVEHGGALYFVNGGRAERLELDSGGREVLCEDARTLQLFEGRLWYLDAAGNFRSMALDGSGQTLVLEGPCAYPYVLGGGLLLAQRGEDEALWLCTLDGEAEWLLCGDPVYAPLLIGQELVFTRQTAEGKRLCRLSLAEPGAQPETLCEQPIRGAAEFFCDGGWRTRLAHEGDLLRQSIRPLESPGEGEECPYSGYHLLDFVGEDLRVDAVYEAGGRLNSFMLYTPEGLLRWFGGELTG